MDKLIHAFYKEFGRDIKILISSRYDRGSEETLYSVSCIVDEEGTITTSKEDVVLSFAALDAFIQLAELQGEPEEEIRKRIKRFRQAIV